jgi:hypothetical protein
MHSPFLKCFVLLLIACMGGKGMQAQALVLCLESDGGVEIELASGARCADRVDTSRGEAPSGAFDNCPEEADHCGDCTDFAVSLANLKTGRVGAANVDAPQLSSTFLLPSPPAPAPIALDSRPFSPELSVALPLSTTASLRATVLLI